MSTESAKERARHKPHGQQAKKNLLCHPNETREGTAARTLSQPLMHHATSQPNSPALAIKSICAHQCIFQSSHKRRPRVL